MRPQRHDAVAVNGLAALTGLGGVAVSAMSIAITGGFAALLPCLMLAWPVLSWRHIYRDSATVTVRRIHGTRRLAADRCMIGYRYDSGQHWAQYTVYLTDGVDTVDLLEHFPYRTRPAERDVARLTGLLLAAAGEHRRSGPDAPDAAARRTVEQDRQQVAAGLVRARAYYGGKDWWVSRRFWWTVALGVGGALLYSLAMVLFFDAPGH
ncbi:MAG TPA: hypothetical protein VFO77_04990 [Actinoplanes sp.]|nr:hypothetical protein [Actinoplanes sp.]